MRGDWGFENKVEEGPQVQGDLKIKIRIPVFRNPQGAEIGSFEFRIYRG